MNLYQLILLVEYTIVMKWIGDKMELRNVYANWVLDDEELLEPHEWAEDDDLEILSSVSVIRVHSDIMYDLYYSQLTLDKHHDFRIVIFSDGFYSIACEFDKERRLKYRSLLTLEDRDTLSYMIKQLPICELKYSVFAYGEIKEFGLTRFEREKKQYILQEMEELYEDDSNTIVTIGKEYLCIESKDKIKIYQSLMEKLEKGYSSIHEILYLQFVKGR